MTTKITQWASTDGSFKRQVSSFRNFIKKGTSLNQNPAAIISICPWAHRTAIVRTLKEIESIISTSVVHYLMVQTDGNFLMTLVVFQTFTITSISNKYISKQTKSIMLDSQFLRVRVRVWVIWAFKTRVSN